VGGMGRLRDLIFGGDCKGHAVLPGCKLLSIPAADIHGGSDKSGILKIFLENPTAQLKIIQFY
jgi:hypothetical protein